MRMADIYRMGESVLVSLPDGRRLEGNFFSASVNEAMLHVDVAGKKYEVEREYVSTLEQDKPRPKAYAISVYTNVPKAEYADLVTFAEAQKRCDREPDFPRPSEYFDDLNAAKAYFESHYVGCPCCEMNVLKEQFATVDDVDICLNCEFNRSWNPTHYPDMYKVAATPLNEAMMPAEVRATYFPQLRELMNRLKPILEEQGFTAEGGTRDGRELVLRGRNERGDVHEFSISARMVPTGHIQIIPSIMTAGPPEKAHHTSGRAVHYSISEHAIAAFEAPREVEPTKEALDAVVSAYVNMNPQEYARVLDQQVAHVRSATQERGR